MKWVTIFLVAQRKLTTKKSKFATVNVDFYAKLKDKNWKYIYYEPTNQSLFF